MAKEALFPIPSDASQQGLLYGVPGLESLCFHRIPYRQLLRWFARQTERVPNPAQGHRRPERQRECYDIQPLRALAALKRSMAAGPQRATSKIKDRLHEVVVHSLPRRHAQCCTAIRLAGSDSRLARKSKTPKEETSIPFRYDPFGKWRLTTRKKLRLQI